MRSLTRSSSRLEPSDLVLVLQNTVDQLPTPRPTYQMSRLHSFLVMIAALVGVHSLYSSIIRKDNIMMEHGTVCKTMREGKTKD